jgi:hypothetical protein
MSIAKDKARKRREAGLCVGCGKNPCECLMAARKQHNDPVPTAVYNRKRRGAVRNTRKGMNIREFREWFLKSYKDWVG